MEKVNERFENQLDIRSLVKTRMNITLLLKLLLSEQ